MNSIWTNPPFLTLVITAGIGQLIKVIIFYIKSRRVHLIDMVATGGMPSTHCATTAGLATIIYLTEGTTTAFFIALSIAFIITVDALGVRRTAGEEGQIIHRLLQKVHFKIKEPYYSLGHTPVQVLVGILFGIVVAVSVNGLLS